MAVEIPNVIQALAVVGATVSPLPGTLLGGAGVKEAIAHAAPGVYLITLDQGAASSQSICQATPTKSGDTSCNCTRPDADHIQVETYLAGVLDDTVGFSLTVHRLPG